MKLNLGLIRQQLKSHYEFFACDPTDRMSFSGVYPYIPGKNGVDSEKLYVIKWEVLQETTAPIRNAICIGGGAMARSVFEERSMQGFIFPQAVSELELLSEFQEIFTRFSSLELDLLSAICANAPMRTIMNCFAEFFRCGAILVDNEWMLLEYSDTFTPSLEIWKKTIQTKHYSPPIVPRERVFMQPSKPGLYSKSSYIHAEEMPPYYVFGFEGDGSYFATMLLFQAEQQFTSAYGWLVDYLCEILKPVVSDRFNSNRGLRNRLRKSLKFMFLHPNINDILLDSSFQKLGWMEDDVYRLLLVLLPSESRGFSHYQYNYENIFAASISDVIAITCDEYIIIILHNDACEIASEALSTLDKQLRLDDGICSIGLEFCGLRKIVAQYVFTQIPFGMYDSEDHIRYYKNIMARHFVTEFNAVIGLSAVMHWAAVRIQKYDEMNGTAYLSTIEAYLLCNRSLNDAANRLYIHKSTMYYRMKCIERLVHVDFEDPVERMHLLLSCVAMRELNTIHGKKNLKDRN